MFNNKNTLIFALSITSKPTITMRLVPTSETLSTTWPYGRLRADAMLSVEFNKNNGFRTVFQSKNPKTGKWNAPKKSTYSQVIVQTIDETGFISSIHLSFNVESKKFNENLKFMGDNFNLFTEQQHEYIYLEIAAMLKVKMMSLINYCGANKDAVMAMLMPTFKKAIEAVNSRENRYESIIFDADAVEGLKVPAYNPFKITSTFKISDVY